MENVLSLYPGQSWDTSILPVLSSYGEPFMDAVCRDSCDGHDVGRVRQEKSCYIGLACDPGLPTDCSRTTVVASCKLSLLLKRCFFGACSKPCNAKLCRNVRPPVLHGVNVERNIVALKIIVTNRSVKRNLKLYVQKGTKKCFVFYADAGIFSFGCNSCS